VQNKVLEAMAMARPVIVSALAAEGLRAVPGVELATATGAEDFARRTLDVLDPAHGAPMGERARARILGAYSWAANLDRFGELLDARAEVQSAEHAAPSSLAMAG
jgi:glycosyltransferase involved in cell wall biosynthesis